MTGSCLFKLDASTFIVLVIILLTFPLQTCYYLYTFAQTQGGANTNTGPANNLALSELVKRGSPYEGRTSAPVTVIDFSDLQCHLCDRFVKATQPHINSTYVQTGKVAFLFLHLPNRGFDSFPAAMAAQCTNDQGKFWQYHNLLYNNQGPIDSGWASKDNLKKFASGIPGLDIQKFNSCFDSQKDKPLVDGDIALAHSLGFTQTPSFIIAKSDGSNSQKLEGPQPFPEFKFLIDKELGSG